MVHGRRFVLSLGVACLLVLSLFLYNPPVQAAGPIGEYAKPPASGSTCNTVGLSFSIPVYRNVPADGQTYTAIESLSVTDGTNTGGYSVGPFVLSPTAGEVLAFTYIGAVLPVTTPGAITMPYTFTYTITSLANGVTVNVSTVVVGCTGGVSTIVSLTNVAGSVSNASSGAVCFFTDGRVNCKAEDAAQTAAIYCTGDGGVTIFAVNNSIGKLAFTATAAEIAKVPANPDKNTLIKEALNIALYRLHGGKLQVNAPDGYVFIWDGC